MLTISNSEFIACGNTFYSKWRLTLTNTIEAFEVRCIRVFHNCIKFLKEVNSFQFAIGLNTNEILITNKKTFEKEYSIDINYLQIDYLNIFIEDSMILVFFTSCVKKYLITRNKDNSTVKPISCFTLEFDRKINDIYSFYKDGFFLIGDDNAFVKLGLN